MLNIRSACTLMRRMTTIGRSIHTTPIGDIYGNKMHTEMECTQRGNTYEEGTNIDNGSKNKHKDEIHTKKGHIQRRDIHGEKIYTETWSKGIHRKKTHMKWGHTRKGDIHGNRIYTERKHEWKRDKHRDME